MKIVFPELTNPVIQEALESSPDITPVPADNIELAAKLLAAEEAHAMIAGIDAPTREVILTCKTHLRLVSSHITSCFIGKRGDQYLTVADGSVCKSPTKEQLFEITLQSAQTTKLYTGKSPIIAMLSYSTLGSGGKNSDLEKIHYVIERIRAEHPDLLIDGEMQLDAAIDRRIGQKKFPNSPVAGFANILICPDLNSANILYKGLEHLGGWFMAGPILQGFDMPVSDLSRGSTVEDVKLTIDVMRKLYAHHSQTEKGEN